MYFTLPFPLARNNDELIENIRNYDYAAYLEKFEIFMSERYGNFDDGQASYRFVEKLKKLFIG